MQIDTEMLLFRRASELSWRATGRTLTNPRVGAIIFDESTGSITSEGYHEDYGHNHAEINALQNCTKPANKSIIVSLEPCNHFGKTPPCTEAIANSGIKKVYIDLLDPNPSMKGQSIPILKDRGIKVEKPFKSNLGTKTLTPFFIQQKNKRPYIIIKMAISSDGFIARQNKACKITNSITDRWVHRWRNETDAILVGTNTLNIDNPQLTSRFNNQKNPVRILIDEKDTISPELKVFQIEGRNILFTKSSKKDFPNTKIIPTLDFSFKHILKELFQNNIGTILVEGGRKLVNNLLNQNYWDEIRIIQNGNLEINDGVKAPVFQGLGKIVGQKKLSDDVITFIER
ncbi:bifunctional diaminohydroxyphosphoribosylaminopyrimidine deaminase/5-amino-6-(5-phosphoribosylamino)uracil reductase RibD [Membranihabitans maritimus]|uniref:bifunctional diaminohydroxyphosphoribosylaminopyrimidine deaminase/5-amino-6-(5-phosphoribosylamino)uracil reductase RibD n=1 Tax=Membranihabitans maritimus TaxID=2904244 RepID=UPI001F001220|nr:bifunctional diaminohydroxyphosphoribosylaminopyrimidine deaminase/5-amino-6-(5-phosphoribosylamino)uracil reductase RibD [Membranihabitans maritimus]